LQKILEVKQYLENNAVQIEPDGKPSLQSRQRNSMQTLLTDGKKPTVRLQKIPTSVDTILAGIKYRKSVRELQNSMAEDQSSTFADSKASL